MRAIVWKGYGPPEGLVLEEMENPVPRDDEVLVRIHAATVSAGDAEMRALRFPLHLKLFMRIYSGLSRPKRFPVLGQEFAGEVESVGKDVKLFDQGDKVFGATGFGFGAYAEYLSIAEADPGEGLIVRKPSNMSYEEAVTFPVGGINALYFLRRIEIVQGTKILINGAGGSIGTLGIQYAKMRGAEVTAVDSGGKLNRLRSLGADHVIDYTREDFTSKGEKYDIIFDVVGKAPIRSSMGSLEEDGTFLLGNPKFSSRLRGRMTSKREGKRFMTGTAPYRTEDLVFLRGLIETGSILPVIDRTYPLEQVPEAHRYVETEQKVGNVVITVSGNEKGG
jgi:NADPH:quinone reductase-like Zn-dependent oxidoreductase